jgi:hypothetical protein
MLCWHAHMHEPAPILHVSAGAAYCVQVGRQGMKLQCSHYFPLDAKSQDDKLPVVVYCHCNSGSRRDAEEAIYHLLPCGVGVVAFDFTVSVCWGQHSTAQHSSRTGAQGSCCAKFSRKGLFLHLRKRIGQGRRRAV